MDLCPSIQGAAGPVPSSELCLSGPPSAWPVSRAGPWLAWSTMPLYSQISKTVPQSWSPYCLLIFISLSDASFFILFLSFGFFLLLFLANFLACIGVHKGIECVRCFDRLREACATNAKRRQVSRGYVNQIHISKVVSQISFQCSRHLCSTHAQQS